MNVDYSLLERQLVGPDRLHDLPHWDLFLAAHNSSERVNRLFDSVVATDKAWLVHPEYGFAANELPTNAPVHLFASRDEAECWGAWVEEVGANTFDPQMRVCIDITGLMRPHLMLALRVFRNLGIQRLDMLYADPLAYVDGDKTPFTKGAVTDVRQVRGFEGSHEPDAGDDDLLIIGAGYDDELIRQAAEMKRSARKLEMFGLPSLQPHMYEENRLRAAKAEESVGPLPTRSMFFAPANDPFATASELHSRVERERNHKLVNLYLSPLATKPQALGFALYYLCECIDTAASIIFPFAEHYTRETSVGLARVWRYHLELDWFI